jgi:flagella basal body P-ring formation protein FlgA
VPSSWTARSGWSPVYAAARDLPAGATLHHGDLVVVRVRLPTTTLRHYLQPTPGQTVAGRVLAAPVRHETLVPAELLLASTRDADLVSAYTFTCRSAYGLTCRSVRASCSVGSS